MEILRKNNSTIQTDLLCLWRGPERKRERVKTRENSGVCLIVLSTTACYGLQFVFWTTCSAAAFHCQATPTEAPISPRSVMPALYNILGVEIKFHLSSHPQSSGQVEKVNRIIIHMFKKYVNNYFRDRDVTLPSVIMAVMSTPQSSAGVNLFDCTTPSPIPPRRCQHYHSLCWIPLGHALLGPKKV